jgi:hypothetical protein
VRADHGWQALPRVVVWKPIVVVAALRSEQSERSELTESPSVRRSLPFRTVAATHWAIVQGDSPTRCWDSHSPRRLGWPACALGREQTVAAYLHRQLRRDQDQGTDFLRTGGPGFDVAEAAHWGTNTSCSVFLLCMAWVGGSGFKGVGSSPIH